MAASRRGPLIRDQWTDEDDRHRSHRDHRSHHRRPVSPEPHQREGSGRYPPRIRGSATDSVLPSTEKARNRSRSPRPHSSRHQHSSRREGPGAREKGGRELDDQKYSRRGRDRELHSPAERKRHTYSPAPERRPRHSDYDRRRNYSPRQARAYSPAGRPQHRPRSPYPPRKDYYSSRDYHDSRSSRRDWDEYEPSTRRGRSRSPLTKDHYRPEASRRPSLSPDRYRRYREDPHSSHRQGSPRSRAHSPGSTYRLAPTRADTPDKVSKSSKRSEKQKQRTLRHLRAKTKANDFLRRLSVSPFQDDDPDDERMQQSTRPIQSILDEPPRHQGSRPASPPRPIPSFDDSHGGGGSHMRDPFPMHGMKANDMHAGHRRGPPHIDTRQPYATSPQYMTPTSSHHGSPHSASPYSQGRGGWAGQQYMTHSK